jgi:MFS family permease
MDQVGERDRTMRALLASPDFLRLWLVGAFANATRWLELLVSGLFAYEVTGSALVVTAVVAARQLPQLLLGAFAGAVSEAVNRKVIVMAALVLPAVVSTLLATLATTGHLALWHVALGNLVSGTMWATEMSTRRRMVGEVAGPHRIVQAIALDSATSAATRIVGPLLGGLAFQWLHMKGAYTLTALVQLVGAFAMAGLVHAQVTRPLALARIPGEILEGLRVARTRPVILLVFGVTIVTNTFAFAYSGLMAPLGLGEFGVSPGLVGLLAAGEPIGGLIGGALIAAGFLRMDRRLVFAGGSALFMVALIVMALSRSYWLALARL